MIEECRTVIHAIFKGGSSDGFIDLKTGVDPKKFPWEGHYVEKKNVGKWFF